MIQLSQQMREWDLNDGSTCKRAHAMPLSYKALGEKKQKREVTINYQLSNL